MVYARGGVDKARKFIVSTLSPPSVETNSRNTAYNYYISTWKNLQNGKTKIYTKK